MENVLLVFTSVRPSVHHSGPKLNHITTTFRQIAILCRHSWFGLSSEICQYLATAFCTDMHGSQMMYLVVNLDEPDFFITVRFTFVVLVKCLNRNLH